MESIVIKTVGSYVRKDRKMVIINGSIHVSAKQVEGKGYTNPTALIGNKASVEFYKNGEEMFNKVACTKENTIVKSFDVESSEEDIKLSKAANAGFKVFAL